MRAMEWLADLGLIRFIGVSNFSLKELKEAQKAMNKYPIVSNQVLYNLNQRGIERDLLPYCEKHKITIIAYTPLDGGRLASGSRLWKGRGMRVLEQIAAQVQKTPAQVALNWCIAHPNVIAIPKSDSVARTIENSKASGWRLSEEHMRLLDEAFS